MSLFSMLKGNAKKALANNWTPAMLVMIIPLLVSLVINMLYFIVVRVLLPAGSLLTFTKRGEADNIFRYFLATEINLPKLLNLGVFALVFFAITFLVVTPLRLGQSYWNFELVKGNVQPVSTVFHFFEGGKNFRRALALDLIISLRSVGWWFVILLVPTLLNTGVNAAATYYADSFTSPSLLLLLWILRVVIALIGIIGIFGYEIVINKYFFAQYFLSENDNLKAREAVKKSVVYSKSYRANLLLYKLSFIGWFILCIAIVPLFYVLPYYNASKAMYGLYVKETVNRENPIVKENPPTVEVEETAPEIVASIISNSIDPEEERNPNWGEDDDFIE